MGFKPRPLSPAEALRRFIEELGAVSFGRAVDSCDIDNYGGVDGKTDLDNASGELDDLAADYWDHIDRWYLASLFYALPDHVRADERVCAVMKDAWRSYIQSVMRRPAYESSNVRTLSLAIDGERYAVSSAPQRADLDRAVREGLL